MELIYSFVTWQSSLIGLNWVALQTVSIKTVRCRTFLFSEVAKFKSPTKTETLFIKIELSEVKENLWRSYLKRRATTSNSVQIQNLSLSFALEGFCMLVDLCINKLLKGCSSVSVDISFSIKKNYYSSHSPCYFSEKKKTRCRKCSFFYKGFEVPNSKRTYHVKIQVFLCISIFSLEVTWFCIPNLSKLFIFGFFLSHYMTLWRLRASNTRRESSIMF